MNKLTRLVIVLAVAALMAISLASSAFAAPITCPGGQTPAHSGGDWYCQNSGDNPTGAGNHKGTGDHL